jgi:hypothetical protein
MNKIKSTPRISLPKIIGEQMVLWRNDLISFPQDYIEFHKDLAEKRLGTLVTDYSLTILKTEMVDDGWLDGMKVLRVVAETKPKNLIDMRWCDANQDFMKKGTFGGHTIIFENELK